MLNSTAITLTLGPIAAEYGMVDGLRYLEISLSPAGLDLALAAVMSIALLKGSHA